MHSAADSAAPPHTWHTWLASDWPGAAGGGRGGEYCVPRHAEAVSTGGGAASAGQFCCTYTSENFTMAGEAPRTFSLLKAPPG